MSNNSTNNFTNSLISAIANHVTNRLVIRGSEERTKEFVEKNVIDDDLDFSVIAPLLEANCIWNKKWNAIKGYTDVTTYQDDLSYFHNSFPFGEGDVAIDFHTANIPPLKWLKTAIDLWKDLEFELVYHETGREFYGYYHHVSGDFIKNNHFRIIEGDLKYIYKDENENTIDAEEAERLGFDVAEAYATGRFAKILARVGLTYEVVFI